MLVTGCLHIIRLSKTVKTVLQRAQQRNAHQNDSPKSITPTHSVSTILHVLACIVLVSMPLTAQNDVVVTTQLIPPYSPYLSDYVGMQNKIVITLTNTTNKQQQLRLVGSVKGQNNGIIIAVPKEFMPSKAIVLNANQSRQLVGVELKEYFDPNNLQFTGISKQQVVLGNGLPEGGYSMCMQAYEFGSAKALSMPAPSGCANFIITHIEPPMIQQPQCNAVVQVANPQNVLFTWTIPAGTIPGKVQYTLTVVEMNPQNINPNQAVIAATDPPFFRKTITTNSYMFTANDPKLEQGKSYAYRVTAANMNGMNDYFFKNNGHSAACALTYGNQNNNNNNQNNNQNNNLDENYAPDCAKLNCAPQPLPQGPASNYTYKNGDEVQIGYFIMTLTNVQNGSAANLTGEGEINMPLFKVRLKSVFSGLKVNAQHKVFEGKARGAYDPAAQVTDEFKNFSQNIDNLTETKVQQLTNYIKAQNKHTQHLNLNVPQNLPFAFSKLVDLDLQLIDIVAIEFAPDGARLNAVMNIDIPDAQNKILAFAQKNVCFHPTGLSVDGLQKLTMLGTDKEIPWGNHKLTVKAADGNNGTFLKWDCNGYKEMQLDAVFTFDNQKVVKANGGGPLQAAVKINAARWGDILATVTVDDFTVKNFQGMKFSCNQVVFDFSDKRNAQGMAFPPSYNGTKTNEWRGFAFKQLTLTLPDYLKQNNKNITIALANVLIDRTGFTGGATVAPVFSTMKDGNVGGWAFSMDSLHIGFVNNSLSSGGFFGKIQLPVDDGGVAYSCLLSGSQSGVKTEFSVLTLDTIEAKLWIAQLKLNPNSGISITAVNNNVTIKAILNGDLTINKKLDKLKNVQINIPNAHFEELTIMNKAPYLTVKTLSLASPNKFFAGFPIGINPQKGEGISVIEGKNDKERGLRVAFHLNLDGKEESAICAGTAFTLWGVMTTNGGKQAWNLNSAELNKITINANLSAVKMVGEIILYKGDAMYGDGFRGAIKATIPSLAEIAATVQFGSTTYKNGNSPYRYWYVDAMFKTSKGGIPVMPGLGINGFGGGVYYHMKSPVMPKAKELHGEPEEMAANFNPDSYNSSPTGVQYIPDATTSIGVKATIFLASMPSPRAFNGDINFEIAFHSNGGLKFIHFGGNGYFVSTPDPANRESNPIISGSADFNYFADEKIFDGKISVNISLKSGKRNILVGGGDCWIYISPQKWYLKIGDPKTRVQVNVLDFATVGTYFMVGKNSLPGIPPLPPEFQAKLPGFSQPRDPKTETGSGFAHGLDINISTGELKFLIFYAEIGIRFGYDISILNQDIDCEIAEGGKIGLNGWYATGQVYTSMTADIGIDINVWFIKAKVSLLSVGVYAALQAGLPNPTWLRGAVYGEYSLLNGKIHGSVSFKFTWGNKCDVGKGDPFGGLDIVADMTPATGVKDVNVFARPEASFTLPISTTQKSNTIPLQSFDSEGNSVTRNFRFFVREFTVTNNKTKKEVPGTYEVINKEQGAVFLSEQELPENVSLTSHIEIRGEEFLKGKWERIKKSKGSNEDHAEIEERTFTTGDAPEHILNSNVIYTNPPRMMRYYCWYTGRQNDGTLRFNTYPNSVASPKPPPAGEEYRFVARFQRVQSGTDVIAEIPLKWNGNTAKTATFDFDKVNLQPETIYIIQFVRKRVKNSIMGGSADKIMQSSDKVTTWNDSTRLAIREAKLGAINIKENEFLIYQLAFKTSKYGSFDLKLKSYGITTNNTMSGNEITYGNGSMKNTMYAEFTGAEAFDYYDLNQTTYKVGSETRYINPLLSIYGGKGSGTWWTFFKNDYARYLDTQFTRHYIPTLNRDYPATNDYPSGSRLTHNTDITDVQIPVYACDWTYTGNGKSTFLTNAEINSVYWLNMSGDMGSPVAASNTIQAQQPKVTNTVRIRYDIVTTIQRDRAQFWDYFKYKWSLNNSGFGNSTIPPSFERSNAPILYGSSKENPNYWSMDLKKSGNEKFPVYLEYSTGFNEAGSSAPTIGVIFMTFNPTK